MSRPYFVGVRLDTKEYEKLKSNAKKADIPISAYIRESSLGKRLHEKPPNDFYKILWNIDKIGTNLNQIAVRVNTYKYLDEKELIKIIAELDKLTNELRKKYIGSG